MTKTTTLIAAVAAAALCPPANAQSPKRVAPFEAPFYAKTDVGDPEMVVGRNGPLELVVRCVPNEALDAGQLVMRSSVDGWALTSDATGQRGLLNLPAGERVLAQMSTGTGELGTAGALGNSAVAPTGEVLTLASETGVMAVGVFERDCVVTGVVTTINGTLP
jgi:hypothetical protein